MMQPLPFDHVGSSTPQLEGAPRSQVHAMRIQTAQSALFPDNAPSTEEKGSNHEATPPAGH